MSELLSVDEPQRRVAAILAGLDIQYDLGDGRPLLDLDLHASDGPTRFNKEWGFSRSVR